MLAEVNEGPYDVQPPLNPCVSEEGLCIVPGCREHVTSKEGSWALNAAGRLHHWE